MTHCLGCCKEVGPAGRNAMPQSNLSSGAKVLFPAASLVGAEVPTSETPFVMIKKIQRCTAAICGGGALHCLKEKNRSLVGQNSASLGMTALDGKAAAESSGRVAKREIQTDPLRRFVADAVIYCPKEKSRSLVGQNSASHGMTALDGRAAAELSARVAIRKIQTWPAARSLDCFYDDSEALHQDRKQREGFCACDALQMVRSLFGELEC
jgi:hypothetical protein